MTEVFFMVIASLVFMVLLLAAGTAISMVFYADSYADSIDADEEDTLTEVQEHE